MDAYETCICDIKIQVQFKVKLEILTQITVLSSRGFFKRVN